LKLLCLSNGHGEDAIAVRILQQLQQHPRCPEIGALPMVGEGQAYSQLSDVSIVGPVQSMPSGGFVYMDSKQFWRDIRSGLLKLTWQQFRAMRRWVRPDGVVLAVGDILPLLFAWLSGVPYVFVGTAKSEYYLRDESGWLQRKQWGSDRLAKWTGSVYLPWERFLMKRRRCRGVFPRDGLTTEILQKHGVPALNLGNPMMDNLQPTQLLPKTAEEIEEIEKQRSLTLALLPGSRPAEAQNNWNTILQAVTCLQSAWDERPILFVAPIAPGVSSDGFREILDNFGWTETPEAKIPSPLEPKTKWVYTQQKATLVLTPDAYQECLWLADIAIAMAGTATEQFVGLGKPAITIPGKGPQFTPAFAEAQKRLLGESLFFIEQPSQVVSLVVELLQDPDWLQAIADNGRRRMGTPGASDRIASYLMEHLVVAPTT
jgi:uncharacterized protein (TIGR03492 family)